MTLLRRPQATLFAILVVFATTGCQPRSDRVVVLAAASSIDAIEAAVAEFAAAEGTRIDVSFGPTSVLARQVEEGAHADLFLAANPAWADYVAAAVPVSETRVVAGNALVVALHGEASSVSASSITSLQSIVDADIVGFAIADPASVPAGIYAAEALRNAGVWAALEPLLIPALDARAALRLVELGEAEAGIVYATDVRASTRVTTAFRIEPRLHTTIEYPLLLLADAPPEARRFFEFLMSEPGRAHFRDHGFAVEGS